MMILDVHYQDSESLKLVDFKIVTQIILLTLLKHFYVIFYAFILLSILF